MSRKKKIYMALSWVVTVAILCVIYRLSAQDAVESQELSDSFVQKILEFLNLNISGDLLRKFAHMSEFTVLSFFLGNSIYATWKTKNATIIAFAVTILSAVGDEVHQIFVPGRAFQTSDILIDSIGALIGAVLCSAMFKLILNIKERGHKNGSIETI